MNIPSVPGYEIGEITLNGQTMKVKLSPEWWLFFTQLIQQLQSNLNDFGYDIPEQTSANIALMDPTKSKGFLVYNSDTDELEVNLGGTFKVITTS